MEETKYKMIRRFAIDKELERFIVSLETREPAYEKISSFSVSLSCEEEVISTLNIRLVRLQEKIGEANLNNWKRWAIVDSIQMTEGFEKLGLEVKALEEVSKFAKLYGAKNVLVNVKKDWLLTNKETDVVLSGEVMKRLGYHALHVNEDASITYNHRMN